jgi:hypothetical protein
MMYIINYMIWNFIFFCRMNLPVRDIFQKSLSIEAEIHPTK